MAGFVIPSEFFKIFSNFFDQLAHLVDTCGVVSARLKPDVFSETSPVFLCCYCQILC
jgi:hypothetical protein